MEIQMPFAPEQRRQVLNMHKICTSRASKKGDIGDYFILDDEVFGIFAVLKLPLEIIKHNLYFAEGFRSPEDFEKTWKDLHNGKFNPDDSFWVHWFTYREYAV